MRLLEYVTRLDLFILLILFTLWSDFVRAEEYFVNPGHPKASDFGAGTVNTPFKTIVAAIKKLQPGDHLTITPGVYREPILLPNKNWAAAKLTTIEGQVTGEGKVVIKGSQLVTNWREVSEGKGLFSTTWKTEPQQVYINDVALMQIGGTIFGGFPERPNHELLKLHASQGGIWPNRIKGDESSMPVNSFFYDAQNMLLYVRCDCESLQTKDVEVSALRYLVDGNNLENILLKNIVFQHSTTSTLSRGEAVTLRGRNIEINHIDVTDMDAGCIGLRGENITLKNSSMGRCGQTGLAAKGKRMHIENNHIYQNNTRGFNKWWEAGGAKFVGEGGISDSEVIGNRVEDNQGDGIWFDWGPSNNLIKSNVVLRNKGFGIHYEASTAGRIEGNVVVRNAQRGIYLSQSSKSLVLNNVVVANGLEGITVVDEGRRDKSGKLNLVPSSNTLCGNVVAWNKGGALILPADTHDNRSDWNTYMGTGKEAKFGLGWWPSRFRPTGLNLGSWQNLVGQDKNSISISRVIDSTLVDGLAKLGQHWKISDLIKDLTGKSVQAECFKS
ncbi:MAG TPA: right-handed parallel beta-helix repeat-containing protein [Methylotenera sp.]|nr:right-handed parallel beta-helix repeat-containing protein [Methylotenera sp.]HPN01776.1 right-handed parallel beta-helix repeat-containing protein [Methylotenera sp.]